MNNQDLNTWTIITWILEQSILEQSILEYLNNQYLNTWTIYTRIREKSLYLICPDNWELKSRETIQFFSLNIHAQKMINLDHRKTNTKCLVFWSLKDKKSHISCHALFAQIIIIKGCQYLQLFDHVFNIRNLETRFRNNLVFE